MYSLAKLGAHSSNHEAQPSSFLMLLVFSKLSTCLDEAIQLLEDLRIKQ